MSSECMFLIFEAALRAALGALVVWCGLRLFRVNNVLAQKAAWAMVLVAALTMPLLMRWHWLPEQFALNIPAFTHSPAASHSDAPAEPAPIQQPVSQPPHRTASLHVPNVHPKGAVRVSSKPVTHADTPHLLPDGNTNHAVAAPLQLNVLCGIFYFSVCAVLLFRLLWGIGVALWLWREAKPIHEIPQTNPLFRKGLRVSARVSSPVNVGSGVVLPADYIAWDAEKLQMVLAHERSHVRQGDFYLQILASLYAAIFWFSPLGWWLKRRLSELSEAISDRAGLHVAASTSSYAQLLLEFAALPRPTLIGVAMARKSNLSRRIESILDQSRFRQAFAGSRRTLLTLILVPAVLIASAALVRVQAAGESQAAPSPKEPAIPQSYKTGQLNPASAPSTIQAPVARADSAENAAPAASPGAPPAPRPSPVPVVGSASPAPDVLPPPELEARVAAVHLMPLMAQAAPRTSEENTFDRTLTVNGKAELSVATGSGNIHLTRGSSGQVKIHGIVRAGRDASEDEVRQIVANPPIEQNGNAIRVGAHNNIGQHNISISYEIEAPADTALTASTGSGNIADDGVGQNAKLSTGSGNITATGLQGGFTFNTGSGNIHSDESGEGDGKAQTGSGDIDLRNVHGGLKAQTGSGDIKAAGTPSAPWHLAAGSGSVELWAGNAPMTLNASTGSGSIHTDRELVSQEKANQHHVVGNLNGGGTEVRIETGSGDITVH